MKTFSMRLTLTIGVALCGTSLLFSIPAHAGNLNLEVEGGAFWFSRNDVRIPGDNGTRFDMTKLTGDGPDAYTRIYANYQFNETHSLRLTLAPLEAEGTGRFDRDVKFDGSTFAAVTDTKGKYQFNTYRLTYRYMFDHDGAWQWGLGGALLIRDAEISLRQGMLSESDSDLGAVPLFHVFGLYQISDRVSLVLDAEGAWAPQGRAVDAVCKITHTSENGWTTSAGYRTLEGGADNDDVYTFAWIHYAMVSLGRRF